MLSITWDDPRIDEADEPAWAVWETECGAYRIYYDAANDTYEPRCLHEARRGLNTERNWSPVACQQPSLEQAQTAINEYHCDTHNLTLVS